ncbi:MAG: hypothetical protein WAM85_20190 [Terracidiphilus sp.]
MQAEAHSLEFFFHEAVRNSYDGKLRLNDPEITRYVARLLCDFSEPDNLFRLREATESTVETFRVMVRAADPVNGTAASFDVERSIRKYIGDYALFISGMYLDVVESGPNSEADRAILSELIQVGKESYFIVSQFNLFEYKEDAPLFARLAERFEHCILGLALIREQLGDFKAPPSTVN